MRPKRAPPLPLLLIRTPHRPCLRHHRLLLKLTRFIFTVPPSPEALQTPGSPPPLAVVPLAVASSPAPTDGRGPSTSSHGSQSPNHEERLDQEERLATRKERLGHEEGRLPMERLDVELDRLASTSK